MFRLYEDFINVIVKMKVYALLLEGTNISLMQYSWQQKKTHFYNNLRKKITISMLGAYIFLTRSLCETGIIFS